MIGGFIVRVQGIYSAKKKDNKGILLKDVTTEGMDKEVWVSFFGVIPKEISDLSCYDGIVLDIAITKNIMKDGKVFNNFDSRNDNAIQIVGGSIITPDNIESNPKHEITHNDYYTYARLRWTECLAEGKRNGLEKVELMRFALVLFDKVTSPYYYYVESGGAF